VRYIVVLVMKKFQPHILTNYLRRFTMQYYTELGHKSEAIATDSGIDVPRWIDRDITLGDIVSISEGGCASGAYMQAVTYRDAIATMFKYGDDVLNYLEREGVDFTEYLRGDESWGGVCCSILSLAVDTWATVAYSEVEDILEREVEAEFVNLSLPSHWASYIVNGDDTSLDRGEIEVVDRVLKFYEVWNATVASVSESSYFTRLHDAAQWEVLATECLDYKFLADLGRDQ